MGKDNVMRALFEDGRPWMNLTEVCKRSGLGRQAVSLSLRSLARTDAVDKNVEDFFLLGATRQRSIFRLTERGESIVKDWDEAHG